MGNKPMSPRDRLRKILTNALAGLPEDEKHRRVDDAIQRFNRAGFRLKKPRLTKRVPLGLGDDDV